MTDPQLVARKLTAMQEHLARLKRRRTRGLEALRSDVDMQDAVAMSMLVVVQEAVDIAFHIATDEGYGVPASFREGFELLSRNAIIEPALAGRLAGSAHLRNRIAHGYASVDVERIWSELPQGIATFEEYRDAIAKWLLTLG